MDTDQTPSFDLPPPSETLGSRAMEDRIARRLFGQHLASHEGDVAVPREIAHYAIVRQVGKGGMGVVYEARDTTLYRRAAIKLLRYPMSPPARERLLAEARALARLSHPNVVQVYGAGELDDNVYVAMEFVVGDTLAKWNTDKSLNELLRVFREAGRGLAAAHDAGIIHRDFKPTNVLVGDDGRVRVADFGLASPRSEAMTESSMQDGGSEPSNRSVAGTRGYIAPELLSERSASEKSDQFAFCVSLWECVTGVRPDPDPYRTFERAQSTRLRPRWLKKAVVRGLAPDPADRWPTIEHLIEELDRWPRIQRRSASLLVGGGLVAGLGLRSLLVATPEPCPDPSASFDDVWTDAAQLDLRLGIAGARPSWHDELDARLGLERGRQRDAWIETRQAVCHATHVAKSQSQESSDRANACLDRHLARIDSMLELLANSGIEQLAELERQLEVLGDPRACARPTQPLPSPQDRNAVDQLRQRLDRLEFAFTAGRSREAMQEVEELVRASLAIPFEPLHMEAHHLQAKIARANNDYALAISAGFAANLAAERIADDESLLRIRRGLVDTHVDLGEDLPQGRLWLAEAEATFDRIGRPADSWPLVLDARAEVAVAEGDLELAAEYLRQAIQTSAGSSTSAPRTHQLELSLANVLDAQGATDEARTIYEQYRDARSRESGLDHPDVGVAELNLCALELQLDDAARARPHCERAFAIQARSFGEDSLRAATPKAALAELAIHEGHHDEAIALATEVWAIQAAELPVTHVEYGNGLELLASAQLFGGQFDAALRSTDQLAALSLARTDVERASLEQNRGWLRCRVQHCTDAYARFESVLALTDDPMLRAYALLGMANVEIELGNAAQALTYLDDSDASWRPAQPDEAFAAEQAWLRAWAVDSLGDHTRARELIALAGEQFGGIDPRPDIRERLAARLIEGETP